MNEKEKPESMRCWKCEGILWPETVTDLHSGVSIQEFVCLNCGRRWYAGEKPRLTMAA